MKNDNSIYKFKNVRSKNTFNVCKNVPPNFLCQSRLAKTGTFAKKIILPRLKNK